MPTSPSPGHRRWATSPATDGRTWDPAHNTIRITPAAPLRRGLPYVVRVRGVRDLRGATMDELFRSRFTVAP